jgi:arginyl-tRNA synthetase
MMQRRIAEIIKQACESAQSGGMLPRDRTFQPIIEIPREEGFGDYSTNIAFILAPVAKKRPQEIASALIEQMRFDDTCERVEVAGKGFINFYVKESEWRRSLRELCRSGVESLRPDVGKGKRVLIEFVSANPTGPLHIGHGRGAAVGDVLANLLRIAGYEVVKEYYVNDAGRQIQTLGASTYLRWKELQGESVDYPKDYYQGDYVRELATLLLARGETVPDNKEEALRLMAGFAANTVMDGIIEDLSRFGVIFDNFYRESSLYDRGLVGATLSELREKDYAYEKDDALWFRTSAFEKDEDRVLVKSDGEKTYFASDIAYHRDKFARGFDLLIDLWGSDHHGYIPRLKASIKALGREPDSLKVILIQFVTLLKEGKPVGMSTRAGEFTTLYDVLKEVGKDAARFFFLMRKSDAHLEFDLDLAKKTSNENPVYYVQYAHARIESIFKNAKEEGINLEDLRAADTNLLTLKEEINLIKAIFHFTDVLKGSAKSLEPHRITFYLLDLVAKFHNYYNKARILGNEKDLTVARLALLGILGGVIKTSLGILGVSAPERM